LHRFRFACLFLYLKWSPIVCVLWMRDRWASYFRYFLSETPLQNLLTARAKSLLHPSKHYYKVEVPWCYCNSDKKTAQKIQKDKIFNENLVAQWQTEKIAKYTMAKCVSSWLAHLKNGQIFRNWPWNGQSCTGCWVQLITEKEILIVVVPLVHCCVIKTNVIVASQLYDIAVEQQFTAKKAPLNFCSLFESMTLGTLLQI